MDKLSALAVTPRERIEEELAEMLASLMEGCRLGYHDNFLQAGAKSLTVFRLLARIRDRYHVSLPAFLAFVRPTIADLAEEIARRQEGDEVQDLVPLKFRDHLPCTPAQARLFLAQRHVMLGLQWNVSHPLQVSGPLDPDVLTAAANDLVQRHEALRSAFIETDGVVHQTSTRSPGLEVPIVDLTDADEQDRHALALLLVREEAKLPIDLSQPPFLRVTLVRFAQERNLVLITSHHAVCDGLSARILARDLFALYRGRVDLMAKRLPPLAAQWADFVAWERDHQASPALKPHIEAAAQRLAPPWPPCHISAKPATNAQSITELVVSSLRIPEATRLLVEDFALAVNATLATCVLAAYGRIVAERCGSTDFRIAIPFTGRPIPCVDDVVGPFSRMAVARFSVHDEDASALVRATREAVLRAADDAELPSLGIGAFLPKVSEHGGSLTLLAFVAQHEYAAPVTLRTSTVVEPLPLSLSAVAPDFAVTDFEAVLELRFIGEDAELTILADRQTVSEQEVRDVLLRIVEMLSVMAKR